MTIPKVVFALQPDYGFGHRASHRAFWFNPIRHGTDYTLMQDQIPSSFDAGNILLATALNAQRDGVHDVTHLVILHNDVVPEMYWISKLVEEMQECGADMLSVVLPIKDLEGCSSTAIDSEDDPYNVERRLTMSEVHDLPPTFDSKDCGYPHRRLLANTGCFILDFTKEWRHARNPDGSLQLSFTCDDRVTEMPDGKYRAEHSPSDWLFSRTIANLGGKVMCTRKIKAVHVGELPYNNQEKWGNPFDKAMEANFGGKVINHQDKAIKRDKVKRRNSCI